MSAPRVDVAQVLANWRGLLAVLAPQISTLGLQEAAEETVQAITEHADPATWRAIGDAFLVELHMTTSVLPGGWRSGITHQHMLRALVAVALLDRAFAAAVAGDGP